MCARRTIPGVVPLIVVRGEVDHSSRTGLMRDVRRALAEPDSTSCLLFDMTDCCYVDSGGLAVFLFALEQLPADGWLGLIGAPVPVYHLLAVCGFKDSPRVHLFQSMEEARGFIEPRPVLVV